MFSLIIMLISIVLVVAGTVGGIYYMGGVATKGNASAQASSLMAQSAQIEAASSAYTSEHAGQTPASLSDLVPQYLSAVPTGWQDPGSVEYPITSKTITGESVCLAFDQKQGYTSIPSCSSITSVSQPVCCQ